MIPSHLQSVESTRMCSPEFREKLSLTKRPLTWLREPISISCCAYGMEISLYLSISPSLSLHIQYMYIYIYLCIAIWIYIYNYILYLVQYISSCGMVSKFYEWKEHSYCHWSFDYMPNKSPHGVINYGAWKPNYYGMTIGWCSQEA